MQKHQIRCEGCSKKLLFEDRHIGKNIKCPACGEAVALVVGSVPAAIQTKTPKPNDVIHDPFAENTEPTLPKTKARIQRQTTDTPHDESAGDSPKKITRKSRPTKAAPQHPAVESVAEQPSSHSDQADDAWLSDESYDSDSTSEPYIDELGLSDLDELQMDDWSAPSALPPAKRRPVKRKKADSPILKNDASEASEKSRPIQKAENALTVETPTSRRWLVYSLFFATLIPLGISVLMRNENDLVTRIEESLQDAEENGEFDEFHVEEGVPLTRDSLIAALPGGKIQGALLAHDSWVHWIFAGTSGVVFTILFLMLFHRYRGALGGAVTGALFTATVGIILLLALQWAAVASQGVWIRGRGIIVLLFYVVKFIGFSYSCALDEGNGFMSSFMGFTLGVGICEELCKILPVIVYLGTSEKPSWQGACLVGLASGVGFGVSEGIMYSSSYYNGISGGEIYLVRFISCVALHAVWTGAGAILLFGRQDSILGGTEGSDILATLALTLGVSILLHGLYDTLLKQEFEVGALLAGLLSVSWLIAVVEKLTRFEQSADTRF